MLIAKSHNLEMENVLRCSLATNEGNLVKTPKVKLLHAIEEEVEGVTVSVLPVNDKACILNTMAILQTLTAIPGTFGELAIQLLVKAVNIAVYLNWGQVDFVSDHYPDLSIKDLERDRCTVDGVQVVQIYSENQKVPCQWKKFMASSENKEELVKFLFTPWKNVDASLLRGVEVILSHEDKCHRFIQSNEQLTYSEVCSSPVTMKRQICG